MGYYWVRQSGRVPQPVMITDRESWPWTLMDMRTCQELFLENPHSILTTTSLQCTTSLHLRGHATIRGVVSSRTFPHLHSAPVTCGPIPLLQVTLLAAIPTGQARLYKDKAT